MKKVFFNRIPRYEPYGGGSHFVTAMVEYLKTKGCEVCFDIVPGIDTMFMIDPRPGDKGYSINHILAYKYNYNPEVKILHRINECDARKNTTFMDNMLIKSANYCDSVIFISEWLQKYFNTKGMNTSSTSIIYNGCNLNHFYPSEKNNNKKIKLVTHHWSDNWLKGFDLYKQIDEYMNENDDIEFTYVGRYNKAYIPKNTKIVNPLHGESLGEELRNHDIYVTASRSEPCGMHHIEGAASGLPVIYHEDTGGIVEMCKNHGESYDTFNEFLTKLSLVRDNLDKYRKKINYSNLDIEKCCEKFYNKMLEMHK